MFVPDQGKPMPLVAGIDSSTQSCKIVIHDLDTGTLVRHGRAPHPDSTEVNPDVWWTALTELLGSGSWWCQAAGVEESEGEGWPVLHPLEPVLGDAVQVVDAAGGEIGHAA